MRFALQLYTVRDHLEKNPAATLEAVKAAGYDYVELAGTAGLSNAEYKALLDAVGLIPTSAHTGLPELLDNAGRVIEAAHTFGYRHIAFSHTAADARGWLEAARQADEAGALLRRMGLQLCYHNHAHEYALFDGRTAHDILTENSDPANLALELDVYWVRYAGMDPVEEIRRHSGRIPLLHVKDMTATEPHTFTEVGRGIIDMPAVFDAAREAGVEWYIVEQDECAGDSLDSARASAGYMKQFATA